jgi:hypothetical protein
MKHKGQPAVRFEDRPVREATPAAESSAVEPPAPPPVDLSQVGRDLASNIQALGQLLHGVLFTLKLRHLETGLPPAVDTHLGFTIQLRAQMTADLLMGYAQENPAVLRVVQGFNGLFTGGQLATVVGAHLVAAAATANLETPISQGAETVLIPDVLAHVEEENRQIERRLRLAAAAAGSANGQPA